MNEPTEPTEPSEPTESLLDTADTEAELPLVVGVRLRSGGPVYDFDPGPLALRRFDRVIVDTDRGPALGTVEVLPLRRRPPRRLQRVVGFADPRDLGHEDTELQRRQGLQLSAVTLIREREVPIKLVKAELAPAGDKVTVFYACEERFEHRNLARDLSSALGLRVEMRQIGARDEARQAGGVGVCGRELCCSSWLKEFEAVSVKMAKAQDLTLNFAKLAGQCGRLKCCLRYEYQTYVELRRELPKVGKMVESTKGDGKVVRQSILKQTVTVRRDEDDEMVEVSLEELVERRPDA
jgi:cell fate regulator YaaT (PSP1 superfamily)